MHRVKQDRTPAHARLRRHLVWVLAHPWQFAALDSVVMFFVAWNVFSSLGLGVFTMIVFFVGQGWSAKRGRMRRYYASGVCRLDRWAP
jgi:hypothetical protein